MKVYSTPASGNSYKIRLFLSLLGLEHEVVDVDVAHGETHSSEFLRRNPRGQVPVLEDGEVTVWDSQAILVYLARRYRMAWLPTEAIPLAEVLQWLAVSQNELLYGLASARAVKRFGFECDLSQAQELGRSGLAVMDTHLRTRDWLAVGRPTVADVACFPYVALAPEGDVTLHAYPEVLRWIARIKTLPGFIGMEGIGSD
jgi:glutathione S-transferase